jgi:hypothetical protein
MTTIYTRRLALRRVNATGAVELYTNTSTEDEVIRNASMANLDALTVALHLYVVHGSDSAYLILNTAVPSNTVLAYEGRCVLQPGDTLWAFSTAAAWTVQVTGYVFPA